MRLSGKTLQRFVNSARDNWSFSHSEILREAVGIRMGSEFLNLNGSSSGGDFILLKKDWKLICRVQYKNAPIKLSDLTIVELKAAEKYDLSGLRSFILHPSPADNYQQFEWGKFTNFLAVNNRVARVVHGAYTFYILPPDQGTRFVDAIVFYHTREENRRNESDDAVMEASTTFMNVETLPPLTTVAAPCSIISEGTGESLHGHSLKRDCKNHSRKPVHTNGQDRMDIVKTITCQPQDCVDKNYVRADPSYLRTLGQAHSGWVFGAIAELIDNSRDAEATKLDISIQSLVKDGREIPMLSVIDDGHGMSHQDILRMLSLGRKAPKVDDPSHIGRFGVGFKTGSMRIGRDVIVLTKTINSRSIGFLSQTLNEGKDTLEIPIVSYCMDGPIMEFDLSVQTKATAEHNLKLIKEFSRFNEYYIGELFSTSKGTGTQIYIWNLDEWGSNYCLEWKNGDDTPSEGDILIRSKRIRRRPGQISQKVPLDYSLRSYLEVIFLDPRMKISVQGSLVKTRPLAKSLNKTKIIKGLIMGKPVRLTLGFSQVEWDKMNCGVFLYWHGRLIEAYKRVGGMVHNADMGRGVIGVIDATDLMNDGKDVWVHNNKQAFEDCEVYAKLEEWLGRSTDEYWDANFDTLQVKKVNADYNPDQEWVQCDKCRKWRILSPTYDSKKLPSEWFCYMQPFNAKCEVPEQEVDMSVVTVGAKRSGGDSKLKPVRVERGPVERTRRASNDDSECSSQTHEETVRPRPVLKRLRRGG